MEQRQGASTRQDPNASYAQPGARPAGQPNGRRRLGASQPYGQQAPYGRSPMGRQAPAGQGRNGGYGYGARAGGSARAAAPGALRALRKATFFHRAGLETGAASTTIIGAAACSPSYFIVIVALLRGRRATAYALYSDAQPSRRTPLVTAQVGLAEGPAAFG